MSVTSNYKLLSMAVRRQEVNNTDVHYNDLIAKRGPLTSLSKISDFV